MDERPPFDVIRACFWLIAGILAVHCLVVLAGAYKCMMLTPSGNCDTTGRLGDLLAGALAAALAFAAGFSKREK